MITIKNYVRAKSLEEAYQLNQKASNKVIGGMLFLKMGRGSIDTAIDLTDLGLEGINETEEAFEIGAMTSLRELEKHEGLEKYSQGAIRMALADIVGVQFRNLATVGGSLYGRFGFSDVLTVLMSMDAEVELYKAGRMPVEKYAVSGYERDILVKVIIHKTPGCFAYEAVRLERTDIPVLNAACSRMDGKVRTVIGARPGKAMIVEDPKGLLNDGLTRDAVCAFAKYAAETVPTGSNLRGSAAYRSHLVEVLTKRNLEKLGGLQ